MKLLAKAGQEVRQWCYCVCLVVPTNVRILYSQDLEITYWLWHLQFNEWLSNSQGRHSWTANYQEADWSFLHLTDFEKEHMNTLSKVYVMKKKDVRSFYVSAARNLLKVWVSLRECYSRLCWYQIPMFYYWLLAHCKGSIKEIHLLLYCSIVLPFNI